MKWVNIGKNITRIRKVERGMSQTDLGKMAFPDITTSAAQRKISSIEKGRLEVGDGDLENIAKCLGVPVVEIVRQGVRDTSFPDNCVKLCPELVDAWGFFVDVCEKSPEAKKLISASIDNLIDVLEKCKEVIDNELSDKVGAVR